MMKLLNVVSWIILAFICNVGGCSIEDEEVLNTYSEQILMMDAETGKFTVMECNEASCVVVSLD